jgi:adenine-specific DNA-methyltransferase
MNLNDMRARINKKQTTLPPSRYQLNRSVEKVRGAVYTPPRIASALTRWAIRSAQDRVLDPSCGEGVFLSAARTRLGDLGSRKPSCIGVDIDPETATLSGAYCEDFFKWVSTAEKVDVILGNPPFIRSHLFPEASRTMAFDEMKKMGFRPSRLMSTWAPFLALSCGLLNSTGRLAMIIPEELLAVGYAEELRQFLIQRFRRVIVCLPEEGIFPEVQQAVVLLMCDNEKTGAKGLLNIEFAALERGDFHTLKSAQPWNWTSKWSHLFLSSTERSLINHWHAQMTWQPFNRYGRVEVGVVTGDNDFFLINQDRAACFVERNLMPIIASTKDLQGIKFGADDFRRVLDKKRPAYVLNVDKPHDKLPSAMRSYIEEGEKQKVFEKYKCRRRNPWYAVPSLWECDAVLFRQSGEMPRVVHLAKKCSATDTIHRVTWQFPSLGKMLSVGFINTWTLINAELLGRSYGGGVLELMPGEANILPLPRPTRKLDSIFDLVDTNVRNRHFHDAVGLVDDVVMPRWANSAEQDAMRRTLSKLIQRRQSRCV